MASNINFINTSLDLRDEFICSVKYNQDSVDPLKETDCDIQNYNYRIENLVFAEPFQINSNGNNSHEDDKENPTSKEDDIVAIDNVLVQKRQGKKYKKYHIDIKDPSNLTCPQSNCNRQFSTLKLLKAHVRKVHCADKNYVCEQCGRPFASRFLLVRHTAVHGNTMVQCGVCAVMLSKRTSLSAHMRTHSGIKLHVCAVCNKHFLRKFTLDTHLKFVHRNGQLECTVCHERFDSRSQWTRHTTQHRTQKQDGAPS